MATNITVNLGTTSTRETNQIVTKVDELVLEEQIRRLAENAVLVGEMKKAELGAREAEIAKEMERLRNRKKMENLENAMNDLTKQLSAEKAKNAIAVNGMAEEENSMLKNILQRLQERESRCGNTITLPGCDYAIPVDVTDLILVRNNGMIQDGRSFSSCYQGFCLDGYEKTQGVGIATPFTQLLGSTFTWVNWSRKKDNETTFVFHSLTNIQNLKYCKNLRSLTICGASELKDYDLSGLTNLLHLNITANFGYVSLENMIVNDHSPSLTNISWIKGLTQLQSVSFRGCKHLADIRPLQELPNLLEIDVRNTAVQSVDFLQHNRKKIQL